MDAQVHDGLVSERHALERRRELDLKALNINLWLFGVRCGSSAP